MKKTLGALVMALVLAVVTCCMPAPSRPTIKPPAGSVLVNTWREFEITFHADKDFSEEGRAEIVAAAQAWGKLTKGRVRISVAFDLDFESIDNLRGHRDARHSVIIGALSSFDIVQSIDRSILERTGDPNRVPIGATIPLPDHFVMVLVLDRIERTHFQPVVTHEFGHVIGLDDLPSLNAIMSGIELRGAPVVAEFTELDVVACRAAKYCD